MKAVLSSRGKKRERNNVTMSSSSWALFFPSFNSVGGCMSDTVIFEIPQDILDSAHLTAPEIKMELAIWLYAQGRLSSGKAHELAGMSLWEFRQVLSSRHIAVHYDTDDLQDDIFVKNQISKP
jgi:predicted HTH domain antitoxin